MADAATAETFDDLIEQIRAHRMLTKGKRVPVTVWLTNEAGAERARGVAADFALTVHLLYGEPGPVHTAKQAMGKTPKAAARALLASLDKEAADRVKVLRDSIVSHGKDARAQIEALTGTPEAP